MPTDYKVCRLSKSGNGNILTPKGRMSFVTLLEPRQAKGSDKKKFSISLLIPADADISLLKKAAADAAKAEFGDKLPPKLKSPFLKAEEQISEKTGQLWAGYEPGMIVIRATALTRPGIVHPNGAALAEGDIAKEAYSGRWACVSLRAFAYSVDGNKGISFGLQNIQLLDHDEPLGGGRVAAEDEFEPAGDSFAGSSSSRGAPAGDDPFA